MKHFAKNAAAHTHNSGEEPFRLFTTFDIFPGGPQTPMQLVALGLMLRGVEFIQRHTIYNVVQLQASDTLIWQGIHLLHIQECQGARYKQRINVWRTIKAPRTFVFKFKRIHRCMKTQDYTGTPITKTIYKHHKSRSCMCSSVRTCHLVNTSKEKMCYKAT